MTSVRFLTRDTHKTSSKHPIVVVVVVVVVIIIIIIIIHLYDHVRTVGVPRNFVGEGGSTNSVEDRENGDLGALVP